MLYQFRKLRRFLDARNYPSAASTQFQVLKRDLTEEEDKGNIEYKEEGIFYTLNGVQYKGYVYLKVPDINAYGFPKVHLVECEAIQRQKNKGWFRNRYHWHNNNVVHLHDRKTGTVHKDVTLEVCQYCRDQVNERDIRNTQDFFDRLGHSGAMQETIRVGIGGYTSDWRKVSLRVKEARGHQCAHCSIQVQPNMDKRFIHVHHKDGNKTNNAETNLEVLCILCHAHVDETHQENFRQKRQQSDLKAFVTKYHSGLRSSQNRFLDKIIAEHPGFAHLRGEFSQKGGLNHPEMVKSAAALKKKKPFFQQ